MRRGPVVGPLLAGTVLIALAGCGATTGAATTQPVLLTPTSTSTPAAPSTSAPTTTSSAAPTSTTPTSTMSGSTPLCDQAHAALAIVASGRSGQVAEGPVCVGEWAAAGISLEPTGDQVSWLLRWNGSAWRWASCEGATGVPAKIMTLACQTN